METIQGPRNEGVRRNALVTGGARGIGLAVARHLIQQGYGVVLADIDLEQAQKSARELGNAACAFGLDQSDPDSITALFAELDAAEYPVDVVVNNAGIISNTSYLTIGSGEWDRVMAINVRGPLLVTQEAVKRMIPRGYGRVVMMSSLAGRSGGISVGVAYSASKAALIGMTRNIARQAAQTGVTVNAVAPGTTATDIIKEFTEDDMKAINASIPVGRLGRPEEIAQAVAFFAAESSGFITGAVLDVNGGMYMG